MPHLEVLRTDVLADEIIVAALSARIACINSYVVPLDSDVLARPFSVMRDWSVNPLHENAARYSWSISGDAVCVMPTRGGRFDLPNGVEPLVFFRALDGDDSPFDIEIAQTFTHAAGIHWRRSRHAHTRLVDGDWDDVVSVSNTDAAPMVSVRRDDLDLHLLATGSVLVRSFDLLAAHEQVAEPGPPETFVELGHDEWLLYAEDDAERSFRVRGFQMIRPRLSMSDIDWDQWPLRRRSPESRATVEFTVVDWRHDRLATVSSAPESSTSYFDAAKNDLPFDTSPAYFRSDVLARYADDTEKYILDGRQIRCRGSWDLEYTVSDAGEIEVLLYRLKRLPVLELKHWEAANIDAPAGRMTEETVRRTYGGEWVGEESPDAVLREILGRWQQARVWWWRPQTPVDELVVSLHRDTLTEWQRAMVTLHTCVVEGFTKKELRRRAVQADIQLEPGWGSLKLAEMLLGHANDERGVKLEALREAALSRNESGVHARARPHEYVADIQERHGTLANHITDLYERTAVDLRRVEEGFRRVAG